MSDKRAHLAQMNAVKLGDALTDDETRDLIEHQKGRSLLLVEAIHGPYTVALDGSRTISLLPGTVVRVPDEHAEPVRNLLRALAVGGPQALAFEDAGDAFVPPTDEAVAAVSDAADKATTAATEKAAASKAAEGDDSGNPEAPLPGPDAQDGEGPWPGDEGYVAPGAEDPAGSTDGGNPPAGDDLAAKRARGGRAKAAGGS